MKQIIVLLSLVFLNFDVSTAQSWQPVGNKIKTRWAKDVNPSNAWQQYPRPQLVRDDWQNLNGLWDYAILPKGNKAPNIFQGKILVPFAVESSLSGVGKPLTPDDELWYKTKFKVPAAWGSKRVLLHFGAVDWQSSIFVNGKLAGEHTGGSDPFSIDITSYLASSDNELVVKVWDPTDSGIQARGKQVLKPFGFWYTAVSGIWQTTWLEPVNPTSIATITPEADIDREIINLKSILTNVQGGEQVSIKIFSQGSLIKELSAPYQDNIQIRLPGVKLWSPEKPNLYQFQIEIRRYNKLLDKANSYFAMRKISMGKDEYGNLRLHLNNKILFQWGVLDQGWWPESLLTPPTAEAMLYDMQVVKSMGFNMIRKHIKVEPARYYYQADSLGLLLWQDMPSGFNRINDPVQHVKFDAAEDWARPKESATQFEKEWKSIIDNLKFFPSIVVWVPFNEGWGQYDSKRVVEWTKKYDPTRLVDGISGWTDRKVGDMYDAHQYPGPSMEPAIQNPGRTMVLGEFGGLGWPIQDHLWNRDSKNWGYRTYFSRDKFLEEYSKLIANVQPLISRGLSSAIYTQTSDVELEVNGLMTYDREIIKLPAEQAWKLHNPLFNAPKGEPKFLVNDSEISPSKLNISFEQPSAGWNRQMSSDEKFETLTGPAKVKKGQSLWAVGSFKKPSKALNLAMKLYAQGDLTIYLNGNVIYKNEKILTKRHYDEFNMTEYSKYLREGQNVIGLELKNAEADSDFDFGLFQY
ncbi:sugar-binding domain-containing protein [Daejeonella sp.]|uniref:glycoside hydrolase family 2 protein n=1 Tax=Daejeonella sp. TaxID=2805397 RepID=UPI0030C5D408